MSEASAGQEPGFLTESERQAVRDAGLLYQLLANEVVGDGPTREDDLTELTTAIHVIQRAVLAQAAGRAYPGKYRLLGEVIPTFDKDGNPLPPDWGRNSKKDSDSPAG
jgi:hypothetical protein